MKKFLILISALSLIACTHSAPEPQQISKASAGHYLDYTPEVLEQSLAETKYNLLFFYASWCPTCHALENEVLRDFHKLPEDLTIIKADFDSEKELKKKYGVVAQHTLVQLNSQGEELNKWIGGGVMLINEELIK